MEKLRSTAIFLATMGVMTLVLRFFGGLPLALDDHAVRSFASVKEVRSDLGIRDILLPAYFPQYLSWPPSELFAGKENGPRLIMQFNDIQTGQTRLSISQTGRKAVEIPSRIAPTRIIRSSQISLKGREAKLSLAVCEDQRPCNKLEFDASGYHISIVARDSEEHLIRIAHSMISD